MNLTSSLVSIHERVKSASRSKETDYYDSNGLLHCGICKNYLEHIVDVDRIKKPDDLTEEQRATWEANMSFFRGRKLRVVCACHEAERKAFEKKQRQDRILENIKACFRRYPEYINACFQLDDNKESRESSVARQFAERFGPNVRGQGKKLLFWGAVGAGKTYLAAAVANAILNQGFDVRFTTINELLALSSSMFAPINVIAQGLCDYDLVVIDDFGTEVLSEANKSKTYQIFSALAERKVAYIVTTNLPPERLNTPTDDYEARIFSRILESCTKLEVKSPKGDRRKYHGT